MAHNPQREDYQRLSLRFARELDQGDPVAATRAFASFGRRFAQDRDGLPQSDADRALHLVARAAEVVDYQLPFATDEQAPGLIQRGKDLLDEALSLDPDCHDAMRMRSSSLTPSIDERYRFLAERADDVRRSCEQARDEAADQLDGERRALAQSIAMRPYWRWMASLAEEALICGRNRVAVDAAEKLLASDPRDISDVRFTLAYALAKLEDESMRAASWHSGSSLRASSRSSFPRLMRSGACSSEAKGRRRSTMSLAIATRWKARSASVWGRLSRSRAKRRPKEAKARAASAGSPLSSSLANRRLSRW